MAKRRIRPAVEECEARLVMTAASAAVVAPAVLRQLHVASTDPAITPTSKSVFYTPAIWNMLHGQNLIRAYNDQAPIVFLGDSITYFWSNTLYPTQGKAVWLATFGTLGAENYGIPGDMTQNILWRVENGELASKPKVVVLMAGINNLIQGSTPQETAAGVSAVVRAIHRESPRTRVLVLGILPIATTGTKVTLPLVQQANTQIQRVIRGDGRASFLDLGSNFLVDGVADPNLYEPDLIHPNSYGYLLLAGGLLDPVRRQEALATNADAA